jgi:hypothetical protein
MIYNEEMKAAGSNYMFLMHHDGTPYSIFYNMVGGNKVIYPMVVVGVFVVYAAIFYLVPYIIKKVKENKAKKDA